MLECREMWTALCTERVCTVELLQLTTVWRLMQFRNQTVLPCPWQTGPELILLYYSLHNCAIIYAAWRVQWILLATMVRLVENRRPHLRKAASRNACIYANCSPLQQPSLEHRLSSRILADLRELLGWCSSPRKTRGRRRERGFFLWRSVLCACSTIICACSTIILL